MTLLFFAEEPFNQNGPLYFSEISITDVPMDFSFYYEIIVSCKMALKLAEIY